MSRFVIRLNKVPNCVTRATIRHEVQTLLHHDEQFGDRKVNMGW